MHALMASNLIKSQTVLDVNSTVNTPRLVYRVLKVKSHSHQHAPDTAVAQSAVIVITNNLTSTRFSGRDQSLVTVHTKSPRMLIFLHSFRSC